MDKGRVEVGGRKMENKRLGALGDGEVSVVGGGFKFRAEMRKVLVCVSVL